MTTRLTNRDAGVDISALLSTGQLRVAAQTQPFAFFDHSGFTVYRSSVFVFQAQIVADLAVGVVSTPTGQRIGDRLTEFVRTRRRKVAAAPRGESCGVVGPKYAIRGSESINWDRHASSPHDRTGRGGISRVPAVKDVGEPCEGEPHARIAGGREETNASRPTPRGTRRLPPTRP